jgi:hypothetical protein
VYSDFTIPGSAEIGNQLVEYYSKRKGVTGIYPVKVRDANTTRLADLTLSFGYPYLYVHQDGCEHVVVFNQAR